MLQSFLFAYLFIAILTYLAQRKIMYIPFGKISKPEEIGLVEYKENILKTSDNETIRSWYHEKPDTKSIMIYFHGNAANLENRASKYHNFAQNSDFNILAITYRGYPGSSGKPSEEGFYMDGRAAIEFARSQGFNDQNIIFYGESIGSGTAVQMATEIKAKALILESPFTSAADVAKKSYWFLPVDLLLKDRFDNIAKINQIDIPLLIFHGEKDKVVAAKFGKKLYNQYDNKDKKLILTEENGHMNFNSEYLIIEINKFLNRNSN